MLGAIDQSYLFDLLQSLLARDGAGLLRIADDMAIRSLAFDAALQDLATLLHRVALAQTVPQAIAEDEPERARLLELAQQFSTEDVQLFYQIAIHGRNEIDLAPDEYAGFTMTLLRMLAFMPGGAQASTRPAPERTAPPTSVAAPPVAQARPQPPQIAEAPVEKYVAGSSVPLDWNVLLGQLSVQGMAKELAKHCVLENFSEGKMTLNLAPQHKHLQTNKMAQEKLQAALAEYFAQPVRLVVALGTANAATPAAVEQHEKQTRQQQAVEAITQDPFVREAQAQFGAQIIEGSIKPIQQENAR
jgi:DNA polymerase-3 subunit gamma/tau